MKTSIQPKDYRFVVFADEQAKFSFLTRSTAQSEETIKWTDGNEYPLVKVQISSASHPFFTGEEKIIDTEGRVDRFKARSKKAAQIRSQQQSYQGSKRGYQKSRKRSQQIVTEISPNSAGRFFIFAFSTNRAHTACASCLLVSACRFRAYNNAPHKTASLSAKSV